MIHRTEVAIAARPPNVKSTTSILSSWTMAVSRSWLNFSDNDVLFSEDIATVGELDPRLAAELGRMSSLHARTSIAADRSDLARISTPWTIRCLSHALGQIDTPSALIAESELTAFLRHDVAQTYATALALPAYETLFDFARRNRRITHAEDALFAAISLGTSPDVVDAGPHFFSELLNMDEEEIARK